MLSYGGINKDNSKTNSFDTSDFGDNSNNNSQKDYNIKANDSSVEGENKVENIGVAVFKEDKLVGELNALETMALLSIRNKIDRFLVSVPDPLNNEEYLDIYITPNGSTSVDVDTSTSSAYVKIKCDFTAQIYSMSKNSKYLSNEVLDIIIIEHNPDVIKAADYIIDLGLEGGTNGGEIIAKGTVEEILQMKKGYTWKYI